MKILMISPMYPSEKDPVYGTFVQTYFEKFQEYNGLEHTHSIFIRGHSTGFINKAIKYWVFYIQILFCLLFKKYDIVYIHTITTTIPPIWFASKFRKLNMVFNVHGADVITVKKVTEILRQLAIPVLYRSKLIVSPSEYFKTVLLKMLPGFDNGKVFVSASGGIDVKTFSPNPVHKKCITLGFVSRIDLGKGWDAFLLLVEQLSKNGVNVKGIIAGRGNEEPAMKRMIQERGLSCLIDYLGPIKHEELPKIFNQMTLFVFPTTRRESLGLVGIEALACGIPVIGSNMAGLPGYIMNGVNGYLFEPGNIDSMIEKVRCFMSLSGKDKIEMSRQARQVALKYDTNVVMQELYEKIKRV